ncbi:MAG: DEAD/DEAH box helicase [Acidobacteriota bacterium]|nr:DEAD/DEAH box helicase [Acidobacteriota bacterium]
MDVERFLSEIRSGRHYGNQIVWVEQLPAREARFADLPRPLSEPVAEALAAEGIQRLYTHQAAAVNAAREGDSLVVVTSTASGKTLCYNVPVLEALLEDPTTRALYLFPTKALAQDQLKTLKRYREARPDLPISAGTYDGDTPRDLRKQLRDEGNIILTNPDMLHSGILPNHARWAHFLQALRFVVIDEVHAYRGIFGSNVANVIRRLRRICRHYGADPVFICCSATIGNPAEHAGAIVGRPMRLVDDDGSPRGRKRFVLWNPPYVDAARLSRRSANSEAQWLMCDLIERYRVQTIAFVRARTTAEILYRYVQDELEHRSRRLANVVRAYRGGYLPSERREIERRLFEGELMGVTTTNALELGIDIGSLDACLMVGYPGSIASTWQQAGRAGRKQDDSVAILIAREDPIDQYLMQHPEYFFDQTHEEAIIVQENPYILYGHARCATQELPVTGDDVEFFGEYLGGIMQIILDRREVQEINGRWFWRGPAYPAGDVSLRSADEHNYVIQELDSGKVIGEMDEWGAFTQLHSEAIYMHDGETYFVEELNLTQRIAYVRKRDIDYFTMSVDKTSIKLVEDPDEPPVTSRWRISEIGNGPAEVTDLVYMFRKIKFYESDSIGFGNLDLPAIDLDTVAFWLMPPRHVLEKVREYGRIPDEGLLGISNAMAGVLPAYVMCDPADIGSVVDSSNLSSPAIFIYDRFPGGVGYSERLFEIVEQVVTAALDLITRCGCDEGCPSCVGSPLPPYEPGGGEIDTRGKIPDKEAAMCILHDLLQREPYEPKPPGRMYQLRQSAAGPAPEAAPAHNPQPLEIRRLPEKIEARLRRRLRDQSKDGK